MQFCCPHASSSALAVHDPPSQTDRTARVDRSGRDRLGTASEDPSPLAGGRYGRMVVTPMA